MCLAMVLFAAQAAMAAAVRVTAERVNLRATASTDSQILTTVTKGTLLEMVGREGDWYRVVLPDGSGAAGYIHSAICEFTSQSAPAVASAAAAPASYPVAAPAPRPAPVYSPSPAPVAPAPAAQRTARPEKTASGGSDDKPATFGVHGSYGSDGLNLGFGGRLGFSIASVPGLGVLGTFDYFLGESAGESGNVGGVTYSAGVNTSAWEACGFATYTFEGESVRPYVGAGLGYFHGSVGASASASYCDPYYGCASVEQSGSQGGGKFSPAILGGARFGHFFGEARYTFGSASHFTLSAGIQF
jgi:hypothetical protein